MTTCKVEFKLVAQTEEEAAEGPCVGCIACHAGFVDFVFCYLLDPCGENVWKVLESAEVSVSK